MIMWYLATKEPLLSRAGNREGIITSMIIGGRTDIQMIFTIITILERGHTFQMSLVRTG